MASGTIIKIEISPNGKYLVTYSKEDRSIIGWNVEDKDEGRLEPDCTVQSVKINYKMNINQICVSDNKKLVYIYNDHTKNFLDIIDMDNQENKIKLDLFPYHYRPYYCTFNSKGEFILYSEVDNDLFNNYDKKIIWIYSTQTKNKWICKGIYKIPDDFELISISKYDKFYLFSNNYFYEWNTLTEKSTRIFINKEDKVKADDIKIMSNEKFACLRIKDKTIIHSIELEIPIVDIDDDFQLFNFMNYSTLYSLLPFLFDLFDYMPNSGIWNSVMTYCWKECLDRLNKDCQLPVEYRFELPYNIQIREYLENDKTKYAFGILDGYVWKFKFEEKMHFSNLSGHSDSNKKDKMICNIDELSNENKIIDDEFDKKTHDLNLHLFSPYMDTINELFQIAATSNFKENVELTNNLIKWEAEIDDGKIKLQVFKKIKNSDKWAQDPICTKDIQIEKVEDYHTMIIASSIFNNSNDIVILSIIGLYIFHFNEYDRSISLNYFYSMDLTSAKEKLSYYKKVFSKNTLPLPNYDSFKSDEWVLYVQENKESFLKYGAALLIFAIKEFKLVLIKDIYRKCIKYTKKDLENNRIFLSIITSTIPKYVLLITDYYIKRLNLHYHSFPQNPQVANLTQSIWWTKYHYQLKTMKKRKAQNIFLFILHFIQLLILPFLFPIFYILLKYHLINNIYKEDLVSKFYGYILSIFKILTITLTARYSWFWTDAIDVKNDEVKEFDLCKKSAKQGFDSYLDESEDEEFDLLYQYRWDIEKDEIKTFEWFKKSAKQEQNGAQNYLGYFYENGIGTQKNLKEAFYWYQKSAENENKLAQYNLISYYQNGWKIDENLAKLENNSKLQNQIGYFYEIRKDFKKAFNWYQKAADNGNRVAQYNLGLYYQNGWEIERDEVKAFEWFKKSAMQGYSDAQNYLGFYYKNGIGIQKDLKKSFEWYEKSAKNNNEIAQYNLGNFYRYGWGIEKDQDKALEWYEKLAGKHNKILIGNDELIGELDNITADNNYVTDNNNPFNCIQFNKPTANISSGSEFISVEATISPGISNTPYIEVKKLQKLLISRNNDIDHILKSQPVYNIGIDFQKDSIMPCIVCWVAKPLNIPILECLETIFEDQFEVIYKVVNSINSNEDDNNDNNDYIEGFDNKKRKMGKDKNDDNNGNYSGSNNNNHGNNNNGKSNNNDGSDGNNNSGSGNNGSGNDDENDDNSNNNVNNVNKKEKRIHVSSKVNAEVINTEYLQDFNISAYFWAKTTPFEDKTEILEFNVDVVGCAIGEMLSNHYRLLKKIGFGYFLNSIRIHVAPIPNGSNLFSAKSASQPRQINRNVEYSTNIENNIGGQIGVSSNHFMGNIAGGRKWGHSTKYLSNEWKLFNKGPNTKGEGWIYEYIDNSLDKDGSHRESFSPRVHSIEWFIHEGMHGFCITITQELCCKITHGWRKFLPTTKPSLLQLFPIMTHSLKVTFNDLKDFNNKLNDLNKTYYCNNDDVNITVGCNESNESNRETQGIQNLDGEIDRLISRSIS